MQESADLKDFITRRYGELGPAKGMSRQEGVLVIGTDQKEWTEGYENILAALQEEPGDSGGPTFSVDDDLQAFTEGTVGWAAAHLTWRRQDGTELPGRITCVFRKEGDEWAIVQAHFSLGVPNEEAFG